MMTAGSRFLSIALAALFIVPGCSNESAPIAPTVQPGAPTSQTFPLTQAGGTFALPGASGTITIPSNNAPAGTMMTITTYSSPPNGAPAVASAGYVPKGQRGPRTTSAKRTSFLYFTLLFTQLVILSAPPTLQYQLVSSLVASNIFYNAYYGNGWQYGFGPASESGQNISYSQLGPILQFAAGIAYLYSLYYVPSCCPE